MVAEDQMLNVLKERFHHDGFRPNQREIVDAVMAGRDVLAVLPTGGGKTLTYFLPSTMLPGMTIVVSPLVALMQEQALLARDFGIPVVFLQRHTSDQEMAETLRLVLSGTVKIMFVSPERLTMPGIRLVLHRVEVSLWVFDEAHCLVEWGHDFRPDYLRAAEYVRLRHEQVAAYTASATVGVRKEIAAALGLDDPAMVVGRVARPNIGLVVSERDGDGLAQIEALARIYEGKSGIIYRNRIVDVERTVGYLRGKGIVAVPYHAQLCMGERNMNYVRWKSGEINLAVATVAFGLGISKDNVRLVVHGDMPRGIDEYYQQLGRAGRDGQVAVSALLYGNRDVGLATWHAWQAADRLKSLERVIAMENYLVTPACRWQAIAAHYGQECEACGVCDNCRKGKA